VQAAGVRIGVDLGGTKIEIVALDMDGGERLRRRVPTPARDYEGTVAAVASLVEDAQRELGGRCPVGIGTPGAISPATGLMKNANSTVLIGKPLAADLERAIGQRVAIANDADCFALSEATDGAAAGVGTVFGVILGTGVGGGIVVNGSLVSGPSAIAGEWGHNPLPWPHPDELPGTPCYCGKEGCIETWLSGPSFARDASLGRERRFADARGVIAAMEAHDAGAQASYDRYVDRLGRSLATIVNVLDPHVIVLGGGMSNAPDLAARVLAPLAAHAFTDVLAVRVVRARHGDSSGVRGAARLP
jgi:fructokinase